MEEPKNSAPEQPADKPEAIDLGENRVFTDVVTPSTWTILAKEFLKDKLALFCLFLYVGIVLTVFIWTGLLSADEITLVNMRIRNFDWAFATDRFDEVRYNRDGHRMQPRGSMREQDWEQLRGPMYVLGTDPGGRSILMLLVYGARNSLLISFAVAGVTLATGTIVGLIAGFYAGNIDNFIMRIIDFLTMVPTLMVMILIIMIFPRTPVFLAVSFMIFGWIGSARVVRMVTLQQGALDYVKASKTLGTPNIVIIFREVVPNIVSFMLMQFTLALAGTMGIETGLTIIGFGLPPDVPSLGALVAWGTSATDMQQRPWLWLPAATLILVMVLCINYVGQAIGRAADARRRRA